MSLKGFPHSEIPGSKLVCSSPGLIAAYRVLHRLLAPRHSPYALSSLTIQVSKTDACRDSGLESEIGVPDCETTPRAQHATAPLLTTHCVYLRNAVKAFR